MHKLTLMWLHTQDLGSNCVCNEIEVTLVGGYSHGKVVYVQTYDHIPVNTWKARLDSVGF